MWQIPCKMTNSSSKPLQTLRQMVPAKKSKKKSQTCSKKKNPKTKLFHTHILWFCVEGVAGDAAALCVAGVALGVAGVALGVIYFGLAWQAWHLATSTFVLRGRRGTCGIGLALLARLDRISRRWRRGILRGRRGTWRHLLWFCVAGVALGHNILWFCVAGVPLTALGRLWWRTWTGLVAGDVAALCVAGAALGDIYCRFAWQVWHLATYTFVLRGRHGTWWHPPAFCVAGVPLTALGRLWWRAWTGLVAGDAAALLRGRRGTWRHLPSFCVACRRGTCGIGLALLARLDRISRRWRRGILRGRRGTWRHLLWFCVAGVALGDNILWFCVAGVPLTALGRLWWRAWTGLVACDAAALCVAGVALGDIYFGFAWQAWHLATYPDSPKGLK